MTNLEWVDFAPNSNLLMIQQQCDEKGWKILRAIFKVGKRQKRIPKFLTPLEIEEFKAKNKGVASNWAILVIKNE